MDGNIIPDELSAADAVYTVSHYTRTQCGSDGERTNQNHVLYALQDAETGHLRFLPEPDQAS